MHSEGQSRRTEVCVTTTRIAWRRHLIVGAQALVCVGVLMTTSGCTTLAGIPDRSVARPTFTATNTPMGTPSQTCEKTDVPMNYSAIQRNNWIEIYLACVDDYYDNFVKQLQQSKAGLAIGTGIMDLTFKVASSLTPSAGVKANYAAAGALLTGSYGVIDKEAFMEKTVSALTLAMDAKRAVAFVPIFRGMQGDRIEYPLSVAFRDLLAYQRAGSLVAGLSFVVAAADKQVDKSNEAIKNIQDINPLTPEQRVFSSCLSDLLLNLKDADREAILNAIDPIDKSFRPKSLAIDKLVQAISEAYRLPVNPNFDKKFAGHLKAAGIKVQCN